MPRSVYTPRIRQAARVVRFALGALQNSQIAQAVIAAANQYGVDPSLALAVAQRESGLNPNLTNPASGAVGVMQLLPSSFPGVNIYDTQTNITTGVAYLAQMIQRFSGDLAAAVGAYDWGPTNVTNAIAKYGTNWLSVAPAETQNYVAAVVGIAPTPPAAAAPLTIDANTGLPIDDSTDVNLLPSVNVPAAMPLAGQIALLTGLGVAAYLLSDLLMQ